MYGIHNLNTIKNTKIQRAQCVSAMCMCRMYLCARINKWIVALRRRMNSKKEKKKKETCLNSYYCTGTLLRKLRLRIRWREIFVKEIWDSFLFFLFFCKRISFINVIDHNHGCTVLGCVFATRSCDIFYNFFHQKLQVCLKFCNSCVWLIVAPVDRIRAYIWESKNSLIFQRCPKFLRNIKLLY